jgi:GntR family transcriptional regulator
MKNKSGTTPVYITIFSELREQIIKGTLVQGNLLPSENELCARYDASRETVRKGLKELEQHGLIYSRPRRGYFVSAPQHDEFTLSFPSDVVSGESRFKEIKIIWPAEEIQEALQIPSNQKVIAFYRISYADGALSGLEIKYIPYTKGLPSIEDEINYAVFPQAANAKMTSFSYYTELTVKAVSAQGEILAMLECPEDEPLLLVSRVYITQAGAHIAYSKQYLLGSYGELHGISGYVQKQPGQKR